MTSVAPRPGAGRPWHVIVPLLLALAAPGIGARPQHAVASRPTADPVEAPAPDIPPALGPAGRPVPVVREHAYIMAARIRPLLFWFGKDHVGLARIVWRADGAGTRGYDLLVGTDPDRAPRRINRWGYISEVIGDDRGALLALMTEASEATYDEAEASTSFSQARFRAIRAQAEAGTFRWVVTALRAERPFTIHDRHLALAQAWQDTVAGRPRQRSLDKAVRPGFLVALADSLAITLAWLDRHPDAAPSPPPPVRYLFAQRSYELRARAPQPVTARFGEREVAALAIRFDVVTLETGRHTTFHLTCGTRGDLAGVPLAVQWQPRWWLRVELRLDPPREGPGAAARATTAPAP